MDQSRFLGFVVFFLFRNVRSNQNLKKNKTKEKTRKDFHPFFASCDKISFRKFGFSKSELKLFLGFVFFN